MPKSSSSDGADAEVLSLGGGDEEPGLRMLQQAFELWINPELERRRAAGELPGSFALQAAQRIQCPDGKILVRINEEIQGIGLVRADRPIEIGDPIIASDLDRLENFDLIDEELDCGHWTVIWTGAHWFTSFNFLSNRARCLDLLGKARQFLEAATTARRQGYAAVAVDNLFSACELASKAELVASHVLDLEAKTHRAIASKLNNWRRHGNVDGAFVDLFNRLHLLRPFYRYEPSQSEQMPITDDDLEVVGQMISLSIRRLSPDRS